MKRLIAIALIMAVGCTMTVIVKYTVPDAWSASQKLNDLPLFNKVRDNARLYVYDELSGHRNITGANFRLQAVGGDGALIKQAQAGYSSVNANTPNSIYRRVFEIKNRAGKILQYINADGTTTIGTPVALAINSIYPTNGTTNLFNNYSVRFCRPTFGTCSTLTGTQVGYKKMMPPPSVTYNKSVRVLSSTTQQYIVGKTLSFDTTQPPPTVKFNSYSVAPGTTYTMRVHRQSIIQHDGEWTSSCGSAMTDNAGVCESTFSTR